MNQPHPAADPFAQIHQILSQPPATGVLITYVVPESSAESLGLEQGDLIVAIDGEENLNLQKYHQLRQPQGESSNTNQFSIVRIDGEQKKLDIPSGTQGILICAVEKDQCAWQSLKDYEDDPDFSGLKINSEIYLQSHYQNKIAGYESLALDLTENTLNSKIIFRLGDDDPKTSWSHSALCISSHQLDKFLSLRQSSFWTGTAGHEKKNGTITLDDQGIWQGTHLKGEQQVSISIQSEYPYLVSGYAATLLVFIFPLHEGAILNCPMTYDGNGHCHGWTRFVNMGKTKITYRDQSCDAWCISHISPGESPEEDVTKYYLDDDRKLLRIDWGAGYGNCWSESLSKEEYLEGCPDIVHPEKNPIKQD